MVVGKTMTMTISRAPMKTLVLMSMLIDIISFNPHNKPMRWYYYFSCFKKKKQRLSPCQSWFSVPDLHYHEDKCPKTGFTLSGQYSPTCSLWVLKHECQKTCVFPKLYLDTRLILRVASSCQEDFGNMSVKGPQAYRSEMLWHFPTLNCLVRSLFWGRSN